MKKSFIKQCCAISLFSFFSCVYADTFHEVKKGETLYSISRMYGLTVDAVKSANNLSGNDIKIGQKIMIPGAEQAESAFKSSSHELKSALSEYTVQKGETWFGISRKYGISVSDLQKMNGADETAPLKVGQVLNVPAAKDAEFSADGKSTVSVAKKDEPSAAQSHIQDLRKNDPHSYSTKKADSSLLWPVKTDDIVYINGKIGGVSLSAKKNDSVTAIRAGTVMFCGSYRGFGNVVFIQSKTGHIYAYTGLGSVDVEKGDYINYTSEIGKVGVDSYSGKSQISLMVFQNGQPIDPAKAPRG